MCQISSTILGSCDLQGILYGGYWLSCIKNMQAKHHFYIELPILNYWWLKILFPQPNSQTFKSLRALKLLSTPPKWFSTITSQNTITKLCPINMHYKTWSLLLLYKHGFHCLWYWCWSVWGKWGQTFTHCPSSWMFKSRDSFSNIPFTFPIIRVLLTWYMHAIIHCV